MDDSQQTEDKHFAEESGIFFEQMGLPRMAGRIIGWLLISDPPHQSMEELTSALSASMGSISTTTRHLIQMGLVERFSLPGVRHDYFRLRADVSHPLIKQTLHRLTIFRQLTEHGLELLDNKPAPTRQWLEEIRDIFAFCEREFPALLEQWEKERKEKQAASQVIKQK